MGDCHGQNMMSPKFYVSKTFSRVSTWMGDRQKNVLKHFAPGEARTHGLQIMRLTRCLLRYGGICLDKAFQQGRWKPVCQKWYCGK